VSDFARSLSDATSSVQTASSLDVVLAALQRSPETAERQVKTINNTPINECCDHLTNPEIPLADRRLVAPLLRPRRRVQRCRAARLDGRRLELVTDAWIEELTHGQVIPLHRAGQRTRPQPACEGTHKPGPRSPDIA